MDSFGIFSKDKDVIVRKVFRCSDAKEGGLAGFLDFLGLETSPNVQTSQHPYIVVQETDLYFVCGIAHNQLGPLAIEVLLAIVQNLKCYFDVDELNAQLLKSQNVAVMSLVEEMINAGLPSVMESNQLPLLVPQPTILSKLRDAAQPLRMILDALQQKKTNPPFETSILAAVLPGYGVGLGSGQGLGSGLSGSGSDLWWRRGATDYLMEEILVDVKESLDYIVEVASQRVLYFANRGQINLYSKLNGLPRCQLIVSNPEAFESVAHLSFHPCVDQSRWLADQSIVFVPPDQRSRLCDYTLMPADPCLPPLLVRCNWSGQKHTDRSQLKPLETQQQHMAFLGSAAFDMEVNWNPHFGMMSCRSRSNTQPESLSQVEVRLFLPSWANDIQFKEIMHGSARVETLEGQKGTVLIWHIGQLTAKNVSVRCQGRVEVPKSKQASKLASVATLTFSISKWLMSNLLLNSLLIPNESHSSTPFRIYKGISKSTVAGNVVFRL